MYWTGLDSAIVGHDTGRKVYVSHTKYMQSGLSIYKKRLISKTGAPKNLTQTPLFGEEETANAEIPQVARFYPHVCRTPARNGSCVVSSE